MVQDRRKDKDRRKDRRDKVRVQVLETLTRWIRRFRFLRVRELRFFFFFIAPPSNISSSVGDEEEAEEEDIVERSVV